MPSHPARSAGLLLFRTVDGVTEVLIGHLGGPFWARRDAGAWSIPKGLTEPGEDLRAAAAREFTEEIGAPPPAGAWLDLGDARQSTGKIVTAYALRGEFDPATAVSNTFEMEWPRGSGQVQSFPEIDRVAWFDVATARTRLHPGQVTFLDRLLELLNPPGEAQQA
ncbi:NUDIX domain-containing protein [Pseudofrankia sp. DC12]|uniref:NUDIX domain-containing protein n=1 Tax=Pseudofrankia sp. DC12 TaxID=683315 RepID=UPI0005F7DCB0|nr:NUDIX domain-containing protein [Pseudofrankia sp. DC12]